MMGTIMMKPREGKLIKTISLVITLRWLFEVVFSSSSFVLGISFAIHDDIGGRGYIALLLIFDAFSFFVCM
ncbi:hypothetical protein QBC41DRAFT_312189 [Cercophora samala]|uniref:Transmembrane protein n=1 Tax=Cercophora samala TaxID=330535 RepID=A0AA40DFH1_9PEZI|nr:hypothetical protein QBC41DRAFT_312189 [Cercophora samala]